MTRKSRLPRTRVPLTPAALVLVALAAACSSSSSPSGTTATPDAMPAAKKDAGHDASHHPSSSSHGSDAGDARTPEAGPSIPDVHPDVILDPHDCVSTTATSSEKGVGGYCSPGGGQCVHAGTGGTATVCTADFEAPAHEWFCTIPCAMDSDCGPGGGACLSAPFGQLCVPTSCAQGLGDAAQLTPDAALDALEDAPLPASDASTAHDATASHDGEAKRDAKKEEDAKKD